MCGLCLYDRYTDARVSIYFSPKQVLLHSSQQSSSTFWIDADLTIGNNHLVGSISFSGKISLRHPKITPDRMMIAFYKHPLVYTNTIIK